MPAHVILFHEFPPGNSRASHWDLMLEHDDCLATWALGDFPQPGKRIQATQLDDHRIDYLRYEGPLSGDRGHVSRWDEGTFEGNLSKDCSFTLQLSGTAFHGNLLMESDEAQEGLWWATFSPEPRCRSASLPCS